MRRLQQSRAENRRLRAFLRIEILVARAEGETVRFAHRWASDDLDRKIEIAHEAANDGELLKILFAKNRGVRLEEMEQFCHHGTDAAKVAGPGSAAELLRQDRFLDDELNDHRHTSR